MPEGERDADLVGARPKMAQESDDAAMSAIEAVEEVQTPTPDPDTSNEGGTATEEQEKDPVSNDGAPAEDTADASTTPVKRKSHRPSLEVVEVTVDSFYDKGGFKQELQVRTASPACSPVYMLDDADVQSS